MASAGLETRLRERFRELGGVDDAFDDLVRRYGEAHRHHHDLSHIGEVIDVVDRLHGDAAVVFAAFFHDAVYDPRSSTNEADSAVVAARALRASRVPHPVVAETTRLIKATADYSSFPDDANVAKLSDADLSVLGRDEAGYERYRAGVRAEYAYLDDDQWREGRAAVLRALLARSRLFVDDHLAAELEPSARSNLARELSSLSPS